MSDPKLLDAFRRQCLAAIRPRRIGDPLNQDNVWLVFMVWLGQSGTSRDDLMDIAKEIAQDPLPLVNCQPKRPQPDWSGDVPPDDEERTEFIVIRPGPGLPPGFLPPWWDGRWVTRRPPVSAACDPPGSTAVAVATATGRFERRGDGALAEVYEVREPVRA